MRKRRRRGDIFIDLTSLLDVVMIVLLVVICHLQMLETSANDQNSEVKEQLQAAEQKLGEAEEASDLYKEQLNAMEGMSEYLVFIIPYEENPEIRHIRLTSTEDSDGKLREIADLNGSEVTDGFEELEQYLKNISSKNPDKTIVLSLNANEDRILYRDRERVLNLFDSLAAVCENVRTHDT